MTNIVPRRLMMQLTLAWLLLLTMLTMLSPRPSSWTPT
jgi:hypothetical protein